MSRRDANLTQNETTPAYTASVICSAVNEWFDDRNTEDRDAAIANLLKQHSHSVSPCEQHL